MDSNASAHGDHTTSQSSQQTGRSLTGNGGGRPSAPAQTHQPNESTSSRAALRPKPTKAPSTTSRFSLGNLKKPQPAVFWSDKKSIDQGQQRTFYNDVTPPPSPSYAGGEESKNSLSIGYPSFGKTPAIGEERGHTGTTAGGEGYDYRYDYVAPQAPIPKRGPFGGLKRKTFWGIVIGVVVVLVLALAIGLGVGLGTGGGSGGGDSDESKDGSGGNDNTSTIETATTTILSDPTSTFTAAPEATSSTHQSTVCPAANNTVFEVPNSPHSFRRLCGVDYPSSGGTEDIAIVWTASVQDCMIYCSGYGGCTACAWGVLPGDNYKDNHRCYLKKNLGDRETARAGWDFAMLE